MKFKRVHVIVNPASGKDQPFLHALNHVFHSAGIDWDIYVTKAAGDARRLATEAVQAGADAVAVYGGDGTIAEVAAGLLGSQLPLAILPGGTTNATSQVLGIPVELSAAADLLVDADSQIRAMDLAQAGDHYFFGAAGIGIPGEVAETDRQSKERLGNLAYALSTIKAAARAYSSDYILSLDGQEVRTNGVVCAIINQGLGLLPMTPPIDGADGLLDVLVIRPEDLPSVLVTITSAVLGAGNIPALEHYQAREVSLVSQPAQAIQADGEVLPAGSVTVKILPAAVHFIVSGTKAPA